MLGFAAAALPSQAQELLKEAFTRELSLQVGGLSTDRETLSREFTLLVGGVPADREIVSRELSLIVPTAAFPNAITNIAVQVSPTGETAVLDWSSYGELSQRDVVRYVIYRSTLPFTSVVGMTPVATVPAGTFTYTFTGLPAYQDEYFAVVPIDVLGGFFPTVSYAASYVLAPEIVSREFVMQIGGISVPNPKEVISRELGVTVATNLPPPAITEVQLQLSPDGRTAILNWGSYPELAQRDVVRYDIYIGSAPFTTIVGMSRFATVDAGTFQVTLNNLPTGGDLYFAVLPVDVLGNFVPTVNYFVGSVLFPEVVSRELSVQVGGLALLGNKEAVSREVSLMVPSAGIPDPVTGLNSGFAATTSTTAYRAVDLDWSTYPELAQRDVVRYRIYVGPDFFDSVASLSPFTSVPVGTQRFTLTGLTGRGIYYFAVVAEDALGQFNPVVRSVSAQATPDGVGEVRLLAVSSEDTALNFTWDAPDNVGAFLTGYRIYFGGALQPLTLGSSTTSYRVTGLLPAHGYPFRITTVDVFNNESGGASLLAATLVAHPAPVTATGFDRSVVLTWPAVAAPELVKHYAVYVSATPITTISGLTPTQVVLGTTATVSGLTNNQTYYFAVATVNLNGATIPAITSVAATPRPDNVGPKAIALSPPSPVIGSLTTLDVTFSEALDGATVSAGDVTLTGPFGPVVVQSVSLPTATTLRASFAPQTYSGVYTLRVGPQLADLAGNLMDQDADGVRGEASEDVFTATLSVQGLTVPDLAVEAVTVSGSGVPGSSATVSWTLRNVGNAPAIGPWTDQVALPFDAALTQVRNVATLPFAGNLAAGGTVTRTLNFIVPLDGPAGTVPVVVKTDASAQLTEIDETNNTASSADALTIPPQLTLTLSKTQIAESDGASAALGTVQRNGTTTIPLTVTLVSDDPSSAGVPGSVTIPAGQTSASFPVAAVLDSIAEATKSVQITASANGFNAATAMLSVVDIPPTGTDTLALTVASSTVLEGDSVAVTVTRTGGLTTALTVNLSSSQATWLTLPVSITLPVGSATASVTAFAPENNAIELDRSVTLTATALSFAAATTGLTVIDDDTPILKLVLGHTVVGESGPLNHTTITVSRDRATPTALTVALTNSDPTMLTVPATVTISSGQEQVQAVITTLDNSLTDGDRTVVLGAKVLIGNVTVATADPVSLSILDDDGPRLVLEVAADLVGEGLASATTATVTRPQAEISPLTVTVISSLPGVATAPGSVVIPAGQVSTTFGISTLDSPTSDGTRLVTFRAEAPGFGTGEIGLRVTDEAKPDLAVSSVSIPATVVTGQSVAVEATLTNKGIAPAIGRVTNRVFLSQDKIPGDDVLIGSFVSDLSLAPGAEIKVLGSIPFPDVTGARWLFVQTDATQVMSEIDETNNFSAPSPVLLAAAYRATVSASIASTPKSIWFGERVRLTGQALDAQDRPVPNVSVAIHSTTGAFRRTQLVETDSAGAFALDWSAAPYELGEVGFAAAHPSEAAPGAQDQVIVLGLQFPSPTIPVFPTEGQSQSVSIVITNPANLPLTGLTATLVNVAPGVQATLNGGSAFSVPAGGTITLQLLLALDATAARNGALSVLLNGPGGLLRQSVAVTYSVSIPRPQLRVAPQPLLASALRGGQTTVDFDIFNDGVVASGPVQILLPPLSWLSAVTANLPTVAAGGSARVSLLLMPSSELPLESQQGTLVVQSATQSVPVGFDFAVVSDVKTHLTVEVVDEFTARSPGAPKVARAHLTIRRALDQQIVADFTTDAAGVFETDQLVEGDYTLVVEGPNRRTFTQTLSLRAGSNTATAVLLHDLVRFTWKVEPVQFEENVRITVETTFETNVPAPVLLIDPPVFDLKTLRAVGDSMTINVTVTNKGFIAAENASLDVTGNAYYTIVPAYSDLGTLPARSSVIVPVQITLIDLPALPAPAASPAAEAPKPEEDTTKGIPMKSQSAPVFERALAASAFDPCAGLGFRANGFFWCFGNQRIGVSAGFSNFVHGLLCGLSYFGPGGIGGVGLGGGGGSGGGIFVHLCGCPNDNDCDGIPNELDPTPNGGPNPPGGCVGDFDCDGTPDDDDDDDDNDGIKDGMDPDDRTQFDEGDTSKNADHAGDPIALLSGNESRTLVDLELWAQVGVQPLAWIRYGNTMAGKATQHPFGNGHNWRHGYQWELLVRGDFAEVLEPSGGIVGYTRTAGIWKPRSPATDSQLTENNGFVLQSADGSRYRFGASGRSYRGSTVFRLDLITDSAGLNTTLSYLANGNLDRVIDAAGNSLKVNWGKRSYTSAEWEPVPFNISLSTTSDLALWGVGATAPYRYYRYWLPDTTLRLSAVGDFITAAPASAPVVAGDALGGAGLGTSFTVVSSFAASGRTEGYQSKRFTLSFPSPTALQGFTTRTQRSTGSKPSDISDFANGYLEAITSLAPTDNWVIESVETADGRVVRYDYSENDDASLAPLRWLTLQNVDYGDTHPATYTYTQPVPGRPPLVRQYDDPRYDYPFSRTRNVYDTRALGTDPSRYGMVRRQETASGKILSERFVNKAESKYEIRSPNGQVEGVVVNALNNTGATRFTSFGDKIATTTGGVANRSVTFAVAGATTPIDSGRSEKRYDSLGREIITERYDAGKGFISATTDPMGRVVRYDRTLYGNVARQILPDGTTFTWTRNALDHPEAVTVTGPGITARNLRWGRDANNRVERIDYPDGSFETFAYNSFGQVTRQRNQDGGIEKFTYDALGRRDSSTNAEGETTTFGYNAPNGIDDFSAHQIDVITDPKGHKTRFFYNLRGQLNRILYADNTEVLRRYDRDGNLERERDELGRWTIHEYDDFGRRTATTNALGETVRFIYDPAAWQDKPLEIRYPGGRIIHNNYDSEWRLTSSTDGYGSSAAATTTFKYNDANNLVKIIDPLLRESIFTYDSRNRRRSATDPLGNKTQFDYDASGNLLTVTRADGSIAATHSYDEMDRRTKTIDARGAVTKFGYGRVAAGDGGTQRVSLTDARGNVYRWRYDFAGRVERMTYPDGSLEKWTYDPAGLPQTFTNRRGDVATYSYDPRNRQTKLVWSDLLTPTVTRDYDEAGRLTALDNGVSRVSYGYDLVGRMLSETQRPAALAQDFTLRYDYDADGLLKTLRYPSGRELSYRYTARQQLASIKEGAAELAHYTYDVAGQRRVGEWGNGTHTDYQFDNAGRIQRIDHRGPTNSFARYEYDYDVLNRRTSQDVRWAEGQTLLQWIDTWGYDETDQLVRADLGRENKVQRWDYDLLGNRERQVDGAETTDYAANALNQYTTLTTAGTTSTLAYDGSGNLTHLPVAGGGWVYSYDAQNRLIEAQDALSTKRVVLTYDGANRQFARKWQKRIDVLAPWLDDETSYTLFNGWNEIEHRDATGGLVSSTVTGESLDELILRSTGGNTAYFHADPLGSIVAQTDATPSPSLRYAFEPNGSFGRFGPGITQPQAPPRRRENGFTGRESFAEFGFADYRNRIYSSTVGRFAQPDPIGFFGGDVNLYRYGQGAATLTGDPLGLYAGIDDLAAMAIGGTIGVAVQAGGDLWNWRLGSAGDYAGALIGGAAGGEATLYGGPIAGGAVGGAATTGLQDWFNGRGIKFKRMGTSALWGAGGGKVGQLLGRYLPGLVQRLLPRIPAAAPAAVRGGAGPVLQGQAGVTRAIGEIEANGGTILGREITLEAGGVRTRPDLLVRTSDGRTIFVEVKNGPSATLTPNQTTAFPFIRNGGAIPRGGNAANAGLPVGQPLPPTSVHVIHYP